MPVADTSSSSNSARSAAPPTAGVDWSHRLQAAAGDDAALLALTRERAPLEVKLAAIAALASEAALKQAELESRDHDRRVHRLAKQRHALAVARREAAAQAARVIEAARTLLLQPLFPLNDLVEIDRRWRMLDASLLDDAQRDEYEALAAQLAAITRERADQPLKLRRWSDQVREALAGLRGACQEAAAGTQDRSQLAAAGERARAAIDAAPAPAAGAPLLDEWVRAEQLRVELDQRLAVLDAVLGLAPPTAETGAAGEQADRDIDAAAGALPGAAQRWAQLAALVDPELDERLQQRFAGWQQAWHDALAARRSQRREQARARQRAIRDEHTQALLDVLQRAEDSLAAGHLAQTHDHLVEIDRQLDAGASAGDLRVRIDALQAQYAQLKGWQHWAGGRARDDLVQQAEALVLAARGSTEARAAKLTTRQLADVIDDMRARWKELDHLGGATSRSLWQRFDAALKTAYEPVAAQVAAQRAARAANLLARQQLLEALDSVALPGVEEGAAAPDWRALAAALEHFRIAWRRLGPVEHTVPHKARDALMQRMTDSVQRIEAPLQDVRRGARLEREALVARARALAAEPQGRELVSRVHELQAQWQQQARAMPLARAEETALWADFKTAIDGAFAAREAAFKARDAEFRARGEERAALIGRLEALGADTPAAQLKRTLAEVEALWQRAGPAPRNDAAALESRFRRAQDGVRRWLIDSAQRSWQITCDALAARLALCDELERSADAAAARADIEARWAGLPKVPDPLESALAARAGLPAAPGAGSAAPIKAATDELLLQLEAAWGLDSPAAYEAARRHLKLQAMKAALESRRPAAAPITPVQALAELLRRAALETVQRERLDTILSSLRRRGSLGAG